MMRSVASEVLMWAILIVLIGTVAMLAMAAMVHG